MRIRAPHATRRTLLAGAAAIGLAPATRAAEPRRGGSITMVSIPEPTRLVGAIDTSGPLMQIATKMFNGLVNYDEDFTPVPELAESWEVAPDGLSMRFNLRRDVTWHDGQPFTSADVKFTIEQVIKRFHARGRGTYANLTEVETPDAHTAIFRLSYPAPYIMTALHGSETPMVPKHIYEVGEVLANPANMAPIGTGPFRFKEWRRGSFILLERNPSYFMPEKPYLDRIIFRVMPDAGARAVAFESGELDIAGAWPVSMPDLERFRTVPRLGITTEGNNAISNMTYIEFNLRDPLFQDVRVRRAIAHCMQREVIADTVYFGFARPATGVISSNLRRFYTPDVPQYAYNLRTAERLLDEAGKRRGAGGIRFEFTIDPLPYGDRFQQQAEYVAQSLAQIGVRVRVRQQDGGSWLRRIYTTRDFQVHLHTLSNLADPTLGVQRQFWSRSIQDGLVFSNGSGYRNERVDAIIEQAQREGSTEARQQLFFELQRIVAADLPCIPLIEDDAAVVYNRRVEGFMGPLMGVYDNFAGVHVTS